MSAPTRPEGWPVVRDAEPDTGVQFAGLAHLRHIASEQSGARLTATLARVPAAPIPSIRLAGPGPLPPISVLIPAHNEAATIAQTIRSLRAQTLPPASSIIVCDNCADDTAAIAHGQGVRVITTVGNTGRKAGAVNQALEIVLADRAHDFFVMVMDADTELSPEWLETAARELAENPREAVGGTYLGSRTGYDPGAGLLSRAYQSVVRQLQFNEFVRSSRLQGRKHHTSVWCLSGTGTMARASMLREIAAERGRTLPGRHGDVYDSRSSTEDFELTLACRVLGYQCVIPKGCDSRTEVMPTMGTWFKQRLRWQFGTLESLVDYGFNRHTRGWNGWTRQALFHLRFLTQFGLWFVLARALATSGATFPPFIVACLVVVYAERLVSVWEAGWGGRLLAALILPEFLYGVSEGAYLVSAIWKVARRKPLTDWGHL